MKFTPICFVGITLLISCSHPIKKVTTKAIVKTDSVKHIASSQHASDTLAIPEDTIPRVTIPADAIQVPEDKVDTTSKVKILDAGSYNEQDDIGPKYAKLNWIGIFRKKNNYYIKPTKIRFIKEHSEMDEEENQKTGWRLETVIKDTCFTLISGVDSLITGPIKIFKAPIIYYAGQKVTFDYEGVTYTLYTTGAKRGGKIQNCKLFLMANVKGHVFNQLLRSLGNDITLDGGGDMANSLYLEFIGDIDGDKIPDFIIGGSGYVFHEDYLFLSKPAGDKAIVKLMAYNFISD
jgi:hypothetical protein